MPQTEPTKIIQYSLRRQKAAKKDREAHWVSIHPRVGYGWTCWIRPMEPQYGEGWWKQHHTTKVIHHDDKSGVVVTEDAIYLPG